MILFAYERLHRALQHVIGVLVHEVPQELERAPVLAVGLELAVKPGHLLPDGPEEGKVRQGRPEGPGILGTHVRGVLEHEVPGLGEARLGILELLAGLPERGPPRPPHRLEEYVLTLARDAPLRVVLAGKLEKSRPAGPPRIIDAGAETLNLEEFALHRAPYV